MHSDTALSRSQSHPGTSVLPAVSEQQARAEHSGVEADCREPLQGLQSCRLSYTLLLDAF